MRFIPRPSRTFGVIAIVFSALIWLLDWAARVDFISEHFDWLRRGAMIASPWLPYPLWVWPLLLVTGLCLIWWDSIRRDQILRFNDHDVPHARATEKDMHERAAKWLASLLSEHKFYVNQAFLFGSIIHDDYQTSDVDLIVEFTSLSDRGLASVVRNIKGKVARDFERTFGHKLHVTFFCSYEIMALDEFLRRAGNYESIITSSHLTTHSRTR